MADKEILCSYGVDFDAVAGWLESYGGENSPLDISRGLFAGEVGVPRLLDLFRDLGIRTTWFVPGHSVETFPEQSAAIVEAGHEVGLHGYSHENPIAMSPEQEEDVLDRCIDLLEGLTGERPAGYVAPWWEFSAVTADLLLARGISPRCLGATAGARHARTAVRAHELEAGGALRHYARDRRRLQATAAPRVTG